jgi:PPIC-type PPIASE domain
MRYLDKTMKDSIRIIHGISRILAFVSIIAYCGCSKEGKPSAEIAVASVDGEVITLDSLKAEAVAAKVPPTPERLRVLLKEVAIRKAKASQANKHLLDQDPVLRAQLERLLASAWDTHQELSVAKVAPTDYEMRAAYKARSVEFTSPARVLVAAIVLESLGSTEQRQHVRALAEQIMSELGGLAGEKFEARFRQLAAQHSADQASRYNGGVLGYFTEGASIRGFPKKLIDEVFASSSAIHAPFLVETQDALYLTYRKEFQPTTARAYEKVAGQIRHELEMSKKQIKNEQYIADIEKASIDYYLYNLPTHDSVPKKDEPIPPPASLPKF